MEDLYNRTAIKLSHGLGNERHLLRTLRLDPDVKHVVKIVNNLDYEDEEMVMRLEVIHGKTLADSLAERVYTPKEVIKCSRDILEGIVELRRSGIYHTDLNDRNVMIDELNDRAVIIDLSCSTMNPKNVNTLNRAFGGNNDLISLGQLIYSMYTSKMLFDEGNDFPGYSIIVPMLGLEKIKNNVQTVRETVYDDPLLLQTYLAKVRRDISDKKIAEFVVRLLDDDLWQQPDYEKVLETKNKFQGII